MNVTKRRGRVGLLAAVGVLLAAVVVAAWWGMSSDGDEAQPAAVAKTAAVPVQGKTTVAFFFANGCVTCLPAAEQVAAVPEKAPDDVAYVAVNMAPGDTESNLRGFLADAGATDMRLVVDGGPLVTKYKVTALSTTIVFDANGKETYRGIEASTKTIAAAAKKAASQGAAG